MPAKYPKSAVQYTHDHGSSSEQCSKCEYFRGTLQCACDIVAGTIVAAGWCNKFERK